jgi:hypothetical protein
MKATPWLLAALLAVAACEDKGTEKPTPAPDKKADTTKTDTKTEEKKAEESGDTKPAKTEATAEDAKMLTERSQKLLEALKSKNVDAIAEFVPEKERAEAKTAFADNRVAQQGHPSLGWQDPDDPHRRRQSAREVR